MRELDERTRLYREHNKDQARQQASGVALWLVRAAIGPIIVGIIFALVNALPG